MCPMAWLSNDHFKCRFHNTALVELKHFAFYSIIFQMIAIYKIIYSIEAGFQIERDKKKAFCLALTVAYLGRTDVM